MRMFYFIYICIDSIKKKKNIPPGKKTGARRYPRKEEFKGNRGKKEIT